MRSIFIFCIAAAILAAMTSCGTTKYVPTEEDELTQIWAGKEYQDIVQSYGAPDRVEMDGNDGSILVYDLEREMNFFLNPEGYCYLVSTNRSVPGNDMEKDDLKEGLIVAGVITGITLTAFIISLIRETDSSDWRSEFEYY